MIQQKPTLGSRRASFGAIFTAEDLSPAQRAREAAFRDWLFRRATAAAGIILTGVFLVNAARGEYSDDDNTPSPPPAVEVTVKPPTQDPTPVESDHALQSTEQVNPSFSDPVLSAIESVLRTL